MFLLKKIITAALLPPGIFVLIGLVLAFFARKWLRLCLVVFSALIYFLSISPGKEMIVRPLESGLGSPTIEALKACDAYVVLGAGLVEGIPSGSEKDHLGVEALPRVVEAYRLYRLVRKPVIVSGGAAFDRPPEAKTLKRTLVSLGVPEGSILMESRSRDTYENAKYTKEIALDRKIRRVAVITSAFHMKRSILLFERQFDAVVACPVGFKTGVSRHTLGDYLPGAGNLHEISLALKEYLGLLYYRVTPK